MSIGEGYRKRHVDVAYENGQETGAFDFSDRLLCAWSLIERPPRRTPPNASAAGRTCSSLSDEKRQTSCSSHMPMYATDSVEASLEFFPSAQAAAENKRAVAGGDDDEAFLVVNPRDVLVDVECL
jgi:hypothetical protein